MSFLNPIEEPVKIYKSTDVNAPQIDFANHSAGDIKTVLKACLITGYGSEAGAGWAISDETDNKASFVMPNVAGSDYKLEIIDNQREIFWQVYYQGQFLRPSDGNAHRVYKTYSRLEASVGWLLLASNQGFYFIEIMQSHYMNKKVCRLSYFGRLKSGVVDDMGKNISQFCAGYYAYHDSPYRPLTESHYSVRRIGNNHYMFAQALSGKIVEHGTQREVNAVEIISPMLFINSGIFFGEQPGLLIKSSTAPKGQIPESVQEVTVGTRPALQICLGSSSMDQYSYWDKNCMLVLLYTDTWSY